MERRFTAPALHEIQLTAGHDQGFHGLDMAVSSGQMESRGAMLVDRVQIAPRSARASMQRR